MSEPTPQSAPANDVGRLEEALKTNHSPSRVDEVLSDFRNWLSAALATPTEDGPAPQGPPPDLQTLLGQLLALRQEVNLQTRAVRNQQEQSAEALRQLAGAVEVLRERPTSPVSSDDAVRALLKVLVDLYDALALAEREIRRGGEPLAGVVDEAIATLNDAEEELIVPPPAPPPPPPAPPPRSLWSRLFGLAPPPPPPSTDSCERDLRREQREEVREHVVEAREDLERVRQTLGSLLSGYQMSLQRLARALAQAGLEAIPAVGLPFDPERMEVLEATSGSGRPAGEVLEEIRRGYLLGGRTFRCAQVRVARG
jgi:molecular chaperone GrpE